MRECADAAVRAWGNGLLLWIALDQCEGKWRLVRRFAVSETTTAGVNRQKLDRL